MAFIVLHDDLSEAVGLEQADRPLLASGAFIGNGATGLKGVSHSGEGGNEVCDNYHSVGIDKRTSDIRSLFVLLSRHSPTYEGAFYPWVISKLNIAGSYM